MDKMPLSESVALPTSLPQAPPAMVDLDWKCGLPVLSNHRVTLRDLRLSDAPSLLAMLTTEDVARFIVPPPTTVGGFERFIVWANSEREAGRLACFAVVPKGLDTAIGIFQLRKVEPNFVTAEWGFVIGAPFRATGLFAACAALVLEFAFETVGVHRLEARTAVRNVRGNGALRKVGAVCEGVLRRSFLRHGEYIDQHLWSILDSEWRAQHSPRSATIN